MLRHPRSKQGRTQFLEAEIDKKMKTKSKQRILNLGRPFREQLAIEKMQQFTDWRREIKERGRKNWGKKSPVDIVG